MSTDFKRLFRNLDYSYERGSGTTYTGLYQAFGHCLRGGEVSIILCNSPQRAHRIRQDIYAMMDKLGVSITRSRWKNASVVSMNKDEHYFQFALAINVEHLLRQPRDSFVFQETQVSEEILCVAKQRFPTFRERTYPAIYAAGGIF